MNTKASHLSHPNYRPDIDGLRAIAVMSVVAFHAFPTSMKGGFIGVDIFFVISGFLISTIIFEKLDRGTFSFVEFYGRRIKRIFPALLLVLIATFSFGWFVLLADEYKQLGKHIAAGAGFVSNLLLWNEAGYFDNSAETKPLLHLWSLGIEEQFYIVWPFILWFAWKRKLNLLTLTIVLTLISFFLNIKGVKQDSVGTFYSPHTRFWELFSGTTLAWLLLYKKNSFATHKLRINNWLFKVLYREPTQGEDKILSNAIAFAGISLLMYAFWQITKEVTFPGKWALIPVIGAVLVILAGPQAWINRKILSNKLIVWFGLISYPLYLWHWPLLSFARIVGGGELPGRHLRILAVALSVVLAWLTYKFIEKPIRWSESKKFQIALIVLLMGGIGFSGFYIYRNDGLQYRSAVQSFSQFGWGNDAKDSLCVKNFGTAEFCRLSRDLNPTIVTIGDSISWQLYFGLAKEAHRAGDTVLSRAQGGCAGFFGFSNRHDFRDCEYVTKTSLYTALNEPSVKVVVFSSFPRYFSDQVMTIDIGFGAVMNKKLSSEKEFLDYAHQSFSKIIYALLAKDKKIIFIKHNPLMSFDPKSCVNRPFSLLEPTDCRELRATHDNLDKKYIDMVDSILSKFPEVKVFDLANVLCDSENCYAMRGKKMLYRDRQHLSIDGSEYIGTFLYDFINRNSK